MINRKTISAVCGGVAMALAISCSSIAAAEEDWTDGFMLRVRGIAVVPDESSSVGAGVGGSVEIDDAIVPELDISYFFTENFALELILATAEHSATLKNSPVLGPSTKLGDFWILPPTLLAQYHLPMGERFKPYVGAGVNYTIVYGVDEAPGITSLDIDNGVGFALQAGVDYMLDDHWFVNADVKKLWLNVDATVNGAVPADIDVDPWIIGFGFGYRF